MGRPGCPPPAAQSRGSWHRASPPLLRFALLCSPQAREDADPRGTPRLSGAGKQCPAAVAGVGGAVRVPLLFMGRRALLESRRPEAGGARSPLVFGEGGGRVSFAPAGVI